MIMEEDDFDNGINDNNNIGDDFFNSNLNTQDTEEHNNGQNILKYLIRYNICLNIIRQ